MIIDTSYFEGDLLIPQKDQPAVNTGLLRFINQYEPKFLSELLGYGLYTEFIAGIASPSPLQKWVDMLQGVEYTNRYGTLSKWPGLIRNSGGSISLVPATAAPISVVVGRGGLYDPIASEPGALSTTTIIPPTVSGNFTFQQRSYGLLRDDEYSVTGNVLTLLNGLTFTNGDTYFFTYLTGNDFTVTSTGINQSPIANYVYYWWLRNNATTTAGSGETSNVPSDPKSPADKMVRAWNEMVDWNRELMEYLSITTVYGDNYVGFFSPYTGWGSYRNGSLFTYINTLGL